jgi:pimeloyl-ACP methyl ester carboxylesterase
MGASGREGQPFSFAQFAADMVGLMDALGVAEAAVIGHSMGGMVVGAGHMLNWDNPEQFNAEVLTFLASVERWQAGNVQR